MRALAGRDAGHLRAERPGHPRHTAKVLFLARGAADAAVTLDELQAHLAARLGAVPVLADRVAQVGRGRWFPLVWVRVRPEVADHVDRVVLPVDGGTSTVEDVVALALSRPLDRSRPLWAATLVDGPGADQQAVVLRVHHAVGDGPQSAYALQLLFGIEAPPSPPIEPEPAPTRTWPVLAAGLRRWAELAGRWRELGPVLRPPKAPTEAGAGDGAGGARGVAPFTSPLLPWSWGTDGARAVAAVSLPLDEVARLGRLRGRTVNHVLLTLVGGAVRAQLEADGHAVDRPLTTASSVGRWTGPPRRRGNHHTGIGFDLCAAERDPARRLDLVGASAATAVARHRRTDPRGDFGVRELPRVFEVTYALGLLVGRILRRPSFSLIATLVRGPEGPLGVGRSGVARVVSYGLLTEDLGLNVTGWSVGDRLEVGITARTDTIDPADLAARLADELAALRIALGDGSAPRVELVDAG